MLLAQEAWLLLAQEAWVLLVKEALVPKVLGGASEAALGALFLDSRCSLSAV